MAVLPDVLNPGLTTVFCGSAASSASARQGAYYAGPGNRFWPILFEAGFTPHAFEPAEFRDLAPLGIGLTDLAKHESGMDIALSSDAYDSDLLLKKIKTAQPRHLAFTGKQAQSTLINIDRTLPVSCCQVYRAQIHQNRQALGC